jgi:hypothetical protein
MKKYIFFLAILVSQKINADVYPSSPNQIDTINWVVPTMVNGTSTGVSNSFFGLDGAQLKYEEVALKTNDPLFLNWDITNATNQYKYVFNLDSQPDSLVIWAGGSSCSIDSKSGHYYYDPENTCDPGHRFGRFEKICYVTNCLKLQCQLVLQRSNHVTMDSTGSFCGDATVNFHNIIFFQSTESLVINAYVYNAVNKSFDIIGSYTITPSSSSTMSSIISKGINLSQFTSSYLSYLGKDIYFDSYYSSSYTGTRTSPFSKKKHIFAANKFNKPDIDWIEPQCYGSKGELQLNSITPIPSVKLHYYIKTSDKSTGITDSILIANASSFPILISGVPLKTDTLTFSAQDFCPLDPIVYTFSSAPTLIVSNPILQSETCLGAENGTLKINPKGGNPYTSGTQTYNVKLRDVINIPGCGSCLILGTTTNIDTHGADTLNFTVSSGLVSGNYNIRITSPSGKILFDSNVSGEKGSFSVPNPESGSWYILASTTQTGGSWSEQAELIYNSGYSAGIYTFSDLVPKTYKLNIMDKNKCSKDTSIIILQGPAHPVIDTTLITRPLCFDDHYCKMPVSVTNSSVYNTGTIYTYRLSNRIDTLIPPVYKTTNNTFSFTKCDTGTFNVKVAINGNCWSDPKTIRLENYASRLNVSLIQPTTINSSIYHIKCYGGNYTGSIKASPMDANGSIKSYYWFRNHDTIKDETLSTLSTDSAIHGLYSVIAKDDSSCTAKSNTITLNEPPLITLSVDTSNNNGFAISCNGLNDGTITVVPHGGSGSGYLYNWSNCSYSCTSNSQVNLYSGPYIVKVTDSLNCTHYDTITLHQPNQLYVGQVITNTFPGGKNVSCNGSSDGIIHVNPIGGVPKYHIELFDHAAQDTVYSSTGIFMGLKANNSYSIFLKDTNNCEADTVVKDLTKPDSIKIESISKSLYLSGSNIKCYGDSSGNITITTSGGSLTHTVSIRDSTLGNLLYGHSFRIPNYGRSIQIKGIPAGSYRVEVTDTNQCLAYQNIRMAQSTSPLALTIETSN